MAIVTMKKLRLMAVRSRKEALLKDLIRLGCVEFRELDERDEAFVSLHRENSTVLKHRGESNELGHAIALLDKYAPEKKSMLSPQPETSGDELLNESDIASALALARSITESDDKYKRLSAEESRERSLIESLAPWLPLDLPLDTEGTERASVLLGSLPGKTDLEAIRRALDEGAAEAELFEISRDKRSVYVLILFTSELLLQVQEALRGFDFTAQSFSGLHGTARESSDAAQETLLALAAEKEGCVQAIVAESDKREMLKLAADKVEAQIALAEAGDKFLSGESVVIMQGYMPAEKEDELSKIFDKYDCAWESEDPAEEEYPDVPVKLKNNGFSNSMNMVTNMYSLPQYGTVDPNPLMAPFFILFYGLMMADIGYGLIMILAAVVMLKKVKPREGTLSFCQLLLYSGIATLLMGVLTGGFFSDAPQTLARMFDPNTSFTGLPFVFSPTAARTYTIAGQTLDGASLILYGSMVLGLLHMNTGMVVSFVEKWKHGDKLGALCEEATQWLLLVAIILAVLGIGSVNGLPIPLIVSIVLLLVGAGHASKGIGGKLLAAFKCVYDTATGWFGDILSYARIMALMLAGGVIGQVFNQVAFMPTESAGHVTIGSAIAFVLIFLFGHAMNFALNILGCYVHDLRLQCLEFFNKFYVSGGKAFAPLRFAGKYFHASK